MPPLPTFLSKLWDVNLMTDGDEWEDLNSSVSSMSAAFVGCPLAISEIPKTIADRRSEKSVNRLIWWIVSCFRVIRLWMIALIHLQNRNNLLLSLSHNKIIHSILLHSSSILNLSVCLCHFSSSSCLHVVIQQVSPKIGCEIIQLRVLPHNFFVFFGYQSSLAWWYTRVDVSITITLS